jgi:hypothetical protein
MKYGWSHTVRIEFVTLLLLFVCSSLSAQQEIPRQSAAVPAISGTVVDAVTGKPISGVDVVLHAERRSWSTKQLRHESSRAAAAGQFQFSPSVDSELRGPLGGDIEVSLFVNGPSDLSFFMLGTVRTVSDIESTLRVGNGIPSSRVSSKAYFPASAHFFRDCNEAWNVTCFVPDSLTGMRIPLIPVLNDPAECRKIEDLNLRDRCRQINTFRAAFLHVDTFAQLRQAKEACRMVDHARISQACLDRLHNYVRPINPSDSVRPSLLREFETFEKVLIVTPPAGLELAKSTPRTKCNVAFDNPRFGDVDPFEEKASYFANYERERNPRTPVTWGGAIVRVVPAITPEERKTAIARALDVIEANAKPVFGSERLPGNSISTVRLPSIYVVAWPSGNKVVAIQFNYPDAAIAASRGEESVGKGTITPQMEHALIQAYLQKYPSSN